MELKQLLNEGVVEVVFTKLDGTERTLQGTRNPTFIPTVHAPKGTGKKLSEDTLSMYVPEIGGWRSFTVANVVSFKKVV